MKKKNEPILGVESPEKGIHIEDDSVGDIIIRTFAPDVFDQVTPLNTNNEKTKECDKVAVVWENNLFLTRELSAMLEDFD